MKKQLAMALAVFSFFNNNVDSILPYGAKKEPRVVPVQTDGPSVPPIKSELPKSSEGKGSSIKQTRK